MPNGRVAQVPNLTPYSSRIPLLSNTHATSKSNSLALQFTQCENSSVEIVWSDNQIAHLATRSERYGSEAHNMLPEWAHEAVNDPNAIEEPEDPSKPHKRARTGYSETYGDLITVLYLDIDGTYYGFTAYPAGRKAWREYQTKSNG